MATYHEITCTEALHKLKRKLPYQWDLNLYRGCVHGCQYCYAVGSHASFVGTQFHEDIFVKTNIVERLERELAAPRWKRDMINIGGVTDSYQPAEKQYRLMPDVLRLLIRYKTPAIISTKSALILRDYDLIDELSRITYVGVAETVTTFDECLRTKLEPGGAPTQQRFEALRELRKTNASVGAHMMPIVPYLTDSRENLDALLHEAARVQAHYVLPGVLYLRGATRNHFWSFIHREFPVLEDKLRTLYKTGGAERHYKNEIYETFNHLRKQYGLSSSYSKPMREKLPANDGEPEQLSLF